MKCAAWLAMLVLLGTSALAQTGERPPVGKRVITFHPFWISPPKTLAENWDLVDAVVVGTVVQREIEAQPSRTQTTLLTDVTTVSTIDVGEVFKGPVSTLTRIRVREHAGTFDSGDSVIRSTDPTMDVGGRYVLFLKQETMVERSEFRPHFGPAGVYALKDDTVVSHSAAAFATAVASTSVNGLLRELRRFRDRK